LKKGAEEQLAPLNPMMAYGQFRQLVRGSEWDGGTNADERMTQHESVDQRVLQGWVGSDTQALHAPDLEPRTTDYRQRV